MRRNATPKGPRTWPGKKARTKARRLREASAAGGSSGTAAPAADHSAGGDASKPTRAPRADVAHLQSRGKKGRGRAQKAGKKRVAKQRKAARAKAAPQNAIH